MIGNPDVIVALNKLMGGELAAMDQYFVHSKMYEDWGLSKLHERIAHEFDDEKGHASLLIDRILLLGGKPDLSTRGPANIGSTVPEMLQFDLDLEYEVTRQLKSAIALCETTQDYQSRDMLLTLLKDTEEDHAHWLEQQLGLIEKLGLQNYLQSQI
ncbi:bacterioferritin [Nitrincola iocasae]|jgi:bacterioferritin|uniref:Bacterioferritin n=1 Tax=Nitrincola iocasae TaxID=2614693 RepID=A0A5J6LD43_9GAMM|nr:bacterioferritin [Nitrincola iocasae]QEW06529.1 bacterioferritin [Nitrincola iocasae]